MCSCLISTCFPTKAHMLRQKNSQTVFGQFVPAAKYTGDVQPNRSESTLVVPDIVSDLRLIQFTKIKKKNPHQHPPSLPHRQPLNPTLLIKSILSLEAVRSATLTFVTPSDSRSEGNVFCPLYCARHATAHTFKGKGSPQSRTHPSQIYKGRVGKWRQF